MELTVPKYNGITKIWSAVGPTKPIDESVNVGEIILEALAKHGEKVIQLNHDTGYKMTASEMRLRSIRMGQNLVSKMGVKPGDVIALMARNNDNSAALVYSCMSIGTPFMPLDVSFELLEVKHMLGIGKPKVIICELDRLNTVQSALREKQLSIPIITFDKSSEEGVQCIDEYLLPTGNENNFNFVKSGNASKTIAAIMCSSGTTGLPKGVIISHAQFASNSLNAWNQSMFTFSSVFWFSGLALTIGSAYGGNLKVITTQKFSSSLFLEIISKHKINALFSPPLHFFAILEDPLIETTDLSSFSMAMCGGSLVSENLKTAIKKYLPNGFLINTYASTEMSGIISVNFANQPNSVGCLVPGIEAIVIDDDDKALPPNEDGEVCFRRKPKFLGYYGNETATQEVNVRDGFIRTGDVGHFDDEGFLYLVDRKKDVLRYCGFQISPSELEYIIEEMDGVQVACVVGVPDDKATDIPAAAIIRNKNSSLTADEISNYVAERVQDAKNLRAGVYFVDKFPLTASGKILRRGVRDIVVKLYNEQNN